MTRNRSPELPIEIWGKIANHLTYHSDLMAAAAIWPKLKTILNSRRLEFDLEKMQIQRQLIPMDFGEQGGCTWGSYYRGCDIYPDRPSEFHQACHDDNWTEIHDMETRGLISGLPEKIRQASIFQRLRSVLDKDGRRNVENRELMVLYGMKSGWVDPKDTYVYGTSYYGCGCLPGSVVSLREYPIVTAARNNYWKVVGTMVNTYHVDPTVENGRVLLFAFYYRKEAFVYRLMTEFGITVSRSKRYKVKIFKHKVKVDPMKIASTSGWDRILPLFDHDVSSTE